MRIGAIGIFLGCATAGAACGNTSATSSCEMSAGTPLPEAFHVDTCREWTGDDPVAARQDYCASLETVDAGIMLQTIFSNGSCPRANILGGCRNTVAGVTYTDWYYAGIASSFTVTCPYAGSTLVPPP
jgi:hypothetical protein